ncbi:MAG: hypothetical protein DLM72_16425 [Candidatus Nitrosopolaris wilkensis]|nr:MAG: hypothetical protein DLM72_16425 [Candidatus Nitrosopolaris wilkensis]
MLYITILKNSGSFKMLDEFVQYQRRKHEADNLDIQVSIKSKERDDRRSSRNLPSLSKCFDSEILEVYLRREHILNKQ